MISIELKSSQQSGGRSDHDDSHSIAFAHVKLKTYDATMPGVPMAVQFMGVSCSGKQLARL